MSNRSRVSHSGIGSGKSRASSAPETADLSKVSGAQAMLDKLQESDQQEEAPKEEPEELKAELKDLRELIFLGHSVEVVEFGGFKFEISTLGSKEKRELVIALGLKGSRDLAAHIRNETMGFAVRTINGVPLENLYELYGGDDEKADTYTKRIFVIESLQSNLVEALFKVYEKLVDESDKVLSPEGRETLKK